MRCTSISRPGSRQRQLLCKSQLEKEMENTSIYMTIEYSQPQGQKCKMIRLQAADGSVGAFLYLYFFADFFTSS